jgi:hypothetical protein
VRPHRVGVEQESSLRTEESVAHESSGIADFPLMTARAIAYFEQLLFAGGRNLGEHSSA